MSLQFDGADVAIAPFPGNSRASSERWIRDKTGFSVNLVEKKHNFFASNVVAGAVEVENAPPLHYDSILGKPGNCSLLDLYRLTGNSELAKVIQDVLQMGGGIQPSESPYKECIQIVGDGSLTYADISHITDGQKFLIHADGRGNGPHCLSAVVG